MAQIEYMMGPSQSYAYDEQYLGMTKTLLSVDLLALAPAQG